MDMSTPQPSPIAECQAPYCRNTVTPGMATCAEAHDWIPKVEKAARVLRKFAPDLLRD